MWDRVKVKTKPAYQPLSLADLKRRVRVDFADDDTLLCQYLNGAIARIDGPSGIGFALMDQAWELSLDCFPAVIELPGAPVTSVTSITYYDSDNALQTVDPAEYRVDLAVDSARIEPVNGWPGTFTRFGAVKIEYRLGALEATDVPADLLDAVCLLVAHRYEMRQAVGNSPLMLLPLGFDSIVAEYRRLAAA